MLTGEPREAGKLQIAQCNLQIVQHTHWKPHSDFSSYACRHLTISTTSKEAIPTHQETQTLGLYEYTKPLSPIRYRLGIKSPVAQSMDNGIQFEHTSQCLYKSTFFLWLYSHYWPRKRQLVQKLTSLAARMMVVICDRSPHSARKVREKAWRKMGETRGPKHFSLLRSGGVVVRASGSEVVD